MKKLLIAMFAVSSLISCKKNELKQGPNNEKTVVKLPQGEEDIYSIALDAKPGVIEVQVLDVRRDIKTEADLNKTMVVKIQNYPTALADYNAAHPTANLQPFTGFTLNSETPFDGTNYTVTFNPGDFAKYIKMKFDPTSLDLTKRYALGFKISTVDPSTGAIISTSKKVALIEIAVKNKYDGIYTVVSGNVQRYTAPGSAEVGPLNGSVAGNPDMALVTVGPNTVELQGLQWAAGSGVGVGGINNLRATVDPATNNVTLVALGNATLSNWAGKVNKYDPATKTFYLAFRWNPTANVREYEIVLKYKGPR